MAQSIAGTNLVANFAASFRIPSRKLEVQWNDVDWTDETGRCRSIEVGHQFLNVSLGLPMLGQGISARATLVMDNYDNRYSPSKSGSIANTNCPDGIYRVPIRIELGYYDATNGDELLRQFTGEIESAPDSESLTSRMCHFECVGESIKLLQFKHTTTLQEDKRADEFIQTLLTAGGISSVALDQAMSVIPHCWVDDENIWPELGLLAASDGGAIHFSKEGQFRFWRMTAFLERADSVSSQVTLTRGKCRALTDDYSWRNAYTGVVVENIPRSRGGLTAVYQAQDQIEIPPGETVVHEARYGYPVDEIITPVGYDSSDPQPNPDYYAVSAGMKDLSANLEVSITAYAQQAHVEFTNGNGNHAIYVLGFTIRGYPLVGSGEDKTELDTTISPPKVPGTKIYTVAGNHYLQTEEQSQRLAGRLRDLLQYPRRLWRWQGPLCPWLELGDRVTVQSSPQGLDADAYVVGFSPKVTLTTHDMELLLLPVANLFAYTGYFILGSSSYANSGSDRVFY